MQENIIGCFFLNTVNKNYFTYKNYIHNFTYFKASLFFYQIRPWHANPSFPIEDFTADIRQMQRQRHRIWSRAV